MSLSNVAVLDVTHNSVLHLEDRKSLFEIWNGSLMDKQTLLKRRLDLFKTIFDWNMTRSVAWTTSCWWWCWWCCGDRRYHHPYATNTYIDLIHHAYSLLFHKCHLESFVPTPLLLLYTTSFENQVPGNELRIDPFSKAFDFLTPNYDSSIRFLPKSCIYIILYKDFFFPRYVYLSCFYPILQSFKLPTLQPTKHLPKLPRIRHLWHQTCQLQITHAAPRGSAKPHSPKREGMILQKTGGKFSNMFSMIASSWFSL